LGTSNRFLHRAMLAMVWIGLAGTLYQTVTLRVYLPVEERLGRAPEVGLAEYAMDLRRAFDDLHTRVPVNAVVQYNTAQTGEYFYLAQVMQVGRQVALATPGCDAVFGGDPGACMGVQQGVARLFEPVLWAYLTEPGILRVDPHSASGARIECDRLGVSYLIATRRDTVWSDSQSWVWTLPLVVAGNAVRVVDCSTPMR